MISLYAFCIKSLLLLVRICSPTGNKTHVKNNHVPEFQTTRNHLMKPHQHCQCGLKRKSFWLHFYAITIQPKWKPVIHNTTERIKILMIEFSQPIHPIQSFSLTLTTSLHPPMTPSALQRLTERTFRLWSCTALAWASRNSRVRPKAPQLTIQRRGEDHKRSIQFFCQK